MACRVRVQPLTMSQLLSTRLPSDTPNGVVIEYDPGDSVPFVALIEDLKRADGGNVCGVVLPFGENTEYWWFRSHPDVIYKVDTNDDSMVLEMRWADFCKQWSSACPQPRPRPPIVR